MWRSRFGKTALRADEAAPRGAHQGSHLAIAERVLEHSSKRRFRLRCEEHCAGCFEGARARRAPSESDSKFAADAAGGCPPPDPRRPRKARSLGPSADPSDALRRPHRSQRRISGFSRNTGGAAQADTAPLGSIPPSGRAIRGSVHTLETGSWRRAQVGTTHRTRGRSLRHLIT